jgi:hypothetical protein
MAGTPSGLSLTPPHDLNLDEDKGRGKFFLESTAKYEVHIFCDYISHGLIFIAKILYPYFLNYALCH